MGEPVFASNWMGGTGVTKRVLSAIAQVVPDDGQTHLTRIDIRPGWGNILNVRLHTPMARSAAGQEFGAKVREAVDHALGDERHSVEIVWDAIAGEASCPSGDLRP